MRPLALAAAMGRGRRTWAVLGEMLELGPDSAAEHAAVGRLAVSLGVSRVVAVGHGAQPIRDGARDEVSRRAGTQESVLVTDVTDVTDTDAAYELLRRHLGPGDVVLVKSSRDAGLRWLGDRLAQDTGSEVPS